MTADLTKQLGERHALFQRLAEYDQAVLPSSTWAGFAVLDAESARSVTELQAEVARLTGAIRAIQTATTEGRVCNDVAWFNSIETLYEFCSAVLEHSADQVAFPLPGRERAADEARTLADQLARLIALCWRTEVYTEGQLATILELDRVAVRKLSDEGLEKLAERPLQGAWGGGVMKQIEGAQ